MGASVVVNYASSKHAADRLVADIKSENGKAVAVKANIANKADIENLFAEPEKNLWPPRYTRKERWHLRICAARRDYRGAFSQTL